jgi:multidrug resistance efflux pump
MVGPGTRGDFPRAKWKPVQATFKQTQARLFLAGDAAEIRVDAFPGVIFRATSIDSKPTALNEALNK